MTSRPRSWISLVVLGVVVVGGMLATLTTIDSRSHAEPAHADPNHEVRSAVAPNKSFYADMASAHERMHRAMHDNVPTGNPDRDFARMMIPHHQGAIDMALIQLKYGSDERLKRLAQSIVVEQGQEIAYMRMLLSGGPEHVVRQ